MLFTVARLAEYSSTSPARTGNPASTTVFFAAAPLTGELSGTPAPAAASPGLAVAEGFVVGPVATGGLVTTGPAASAGNTVRPSCCERTHKYPAAAQPHSTNTAVPLRIPWLISFP